MGGPVLGPCQGVREPPALPSLPPKGLLLVLQEGLVRSEGLGDVGLGGGLGGGGLLGLRGALAFGFKPLLELLAPGPGAVERLAQPPGPLLRRLEVRDERRPPPVQVLDAPPGFDGVGLGPGPALHRAEDLSPGLGEGRTQPLLLLGVALPARGELGGQVGVLAHQGLDAALQRRRPVPLLGRLPPGRVLRLGALPLGPVEHGKSLLVPGRGGRRARGALLDLPPQPLDGLGQGGGLGGPQSSLLLGPVDPVPGGSQGVPRSGAFLVAGGLGRLQLREPARQVGQLSGAVPDLPLQALGERTDEGLEPRLGRLQCLDGPRRVFGLLLEAAHGPPGPAQVGLGPGLLPPGRLQRLARLFGLGQHRTVVGTELAEPLRVRLDRLPQSLELPGAVELPNDGD